MLLIYGVQSLSRLSGLLALFSWQVVIIGLVSEGVGSLSIGVLLSESESEMLESSESINNLSGLYLLLKVLRLILSISLDILTTQVLLTYPNL